jgi:hypothetical protein
MNTAVVQHAPHRSRWRRRTGIIGVLLFLAALGAAYWPVLRYLREKELRKALTEVDQSDPGWRWDEMESLRATIPDNENAALVLLSAAQQLPQGWPVWRSSGKQIADEKELGIDDLPPNAPFSATHFQILAGGLHDAAAALNEARKLADHPRGRFAITLGRSPWGTVLPYDDPVRRVVRLLGYDAVARAQKQDLDGALASCRAMLNASRSIGDDPFIGGQLARIATRCAVLDRVERVLGQGEPSESALAALQQLVEDDEGQPLSVIGLRGERANMDRFMASIESGELTRADVQSEMASAGLTPGDVMIWYMFSGVRKTRLALLRDISKTIEIAKQEPSGEQITQLQQADAGVRQLPLLAKFIAPATRSFGDAYRRSRVELRCVAVALAAERYRRTHGDWPPDLAGLVPKYIPSVPKDFYDGQPLRYRRLADHLIIYSVGPDEQDNGGTIDRGKTTTTGIDDGIRLWDPPQRRRSGAPQKSEFRPK